MLYFSLFSGEIYESEEKLSDPFQILLRQRPNANCKKCFGRLYTSYNTTKKIYELCPRCLKKCIIINDYSDGMLTKADGDGSLLNPGPLLYTNQ
jgi:hypothetical protein